LIKSILVALALTIKWYQIVHVAVHFFIEWLIFGINFFFKFLRHETNDDDVPFWNLVDNSFRLLRPLSFAGKQSVE
jgi:hypothetical protein